MQSSDPKESQLHDGVYCTRRLPSLPSYVCNTPRLPRRAAYVDGTKGVFVIMLGLWS